jgi:protein-disulfide isomerase
MNTKRMERSVGQKNHKKKGSAADSLAAKKGASSMNRFYYILGAVALVGIIAVGFQVGGQAMSSAATEPVDLGSVMDDPNELVQLARPVIKGNPDAPITVLEFADFQCPACGQFAREHAPLIERGYVDGGNVKVAFYDFPLVSIHPHAFLAARAGRCAEDQDGFWEYHDEIFRNQRDWSSQADPSGSFVEYAETVGLNGGDFRECLNSDRHAELITAQMELARQLRLSGTPTVMINQGGGMATRLASFDFGTVSEALDEALATLDAGPGAEDPGQPE